MSTVEKPIGTATINSDGTIVLDLRAEGPNGEIGMSRLVYPPSHPQYSMIKGHVGDIKPGEKKLVLPFPP